MSLFKFKHFNINQSNAPQKVGTDAMILGALAYPQNLIVENPGSILDVGTGCGVIALMMAQHFPNAKITGIDIDESAITLAQLNFKNASQKSRLPNEFKTLQTSYLDYQPKENFDLIISNPPYFNTKMPSINLKRNLARHENGMTLEHVINHSEKMLSKKGELWIIVPAERTVKLLDSPLNLHLIQQIQIFGKPNRHVRDVLVFSKNKITTTISNLTIRNKENQYTEAYKILTREFHYNSI